MSAYRAATLQNIAAVHFRDGANVLQDVSVGRFRDGTNASKVFFESISASVSPDTVQGYGNSGGGVTITTPTATCTITGGVAPYTYLWTRTDGGADSWSIGFSTSASTDFTATGVTDSATGTFICTVTDATDATAATGPATALALNLGSPL